MVSAVQARSLDLRVRDGARVRGLARGNRRLLQPVAGGTIEVEPSRVLIRGTDGNDDIRVKNAGSRLFVDLNGEERQLTRQEWRNKRIVIEGLGGDNRIDASGMRVGVVVRGGGGDDTLLGGAGDDRIMGGRSEGRNTVWAGAGDDVVNAGGILSNIVVDGPGLKKLNNGVQTTSDQIIVHGTDGPDVIVVGATPNGGLRIEMNGAARDFSPLELRGRELIIEGYGDNDRIDASASDRPAIVFGGRGDDEIKGTKGRDRLVGGPGNDHLNGIANRDTFKGGWDLDTLVGTGDLEGGPSADSLNADLRSNMDGGPGIDIDWITFGREGGTVRAQPGDLVSGNAPIARTDVGWLEGGRAYVEGLRSETRKVPANHPYRIYVENLRAELAARGLPQSAEGVEITVYGVSAGVGLGDMVVRTLVDPQLGIAPGADVILLDMPGPSNEGGDTSDLTGLAALMGRAEARLSDAVKSAETAVNLVSGSVPKNADGTAADKKPRFVVLSWGSSRGSAASWLSEHLRGIPENSAYREVVRKTDARLGRSTASLSEAERNLEIDVTVNELFQNFVDQRVASGRGLGRARKSLEDAVKRAAGLGVAVVSASGNAQADADHFRDPRAAFSAVDDTRNVILVGAAELGGDGSAESAQVASFSSGGRNLFMLAPGARVPMDFDGARRPVDNVDDTGVAAAFFSGIAAIMARPNPQVVSIPKTTVEIVGLLATTARPLPENSRAGAGMIDPVRAIQLAQGGG